MKEFLSYLSAAEYWGIPQLDDLLGKEYKDRNSNVHDVTVTTSGSRRRNRKCVSHSCEIFLPRDAVIKCGNDAVASPALLFLELASELDMHRLILLGLQMCSHPPGGRAKTITSKHELEIFIKKTAGHRGHRKAECALKYIEDGSASIMESLAFMMLTLPNYYGGYGLRGAILNHEIFLEEKGRRQLKQKRCFVDMFYKKAKIAVEYDSFTYHKQPSEQSKDMIRSTFLERQGIKVIRLGTTQFYNKETFEMFACNLASRLGKQIRIRTKNFQTENRNLRKLLPPSNNASHLNNYEIKK